MPGPYSQMFEKAIEPLRGYGADVHPLMYDAPLSATMLAATSIPAGRVVHLNSSGEFDLGASSSQMPIFLWQGRDDGDVYNNGTSPTTSTTHWWATLPNKKMSGFVATGGYELQTTEFISGTYTPNQLLSVDSDGKLRNTSNTQYTNLIVGVASFHKAQDVDTTPTGPVGTNAHGVSVLSFWTYFLPASS